MPRLLSPASLLSALILSTLVSPDTFAEQKAAPNQALRAEMTRLFTQLYEHMFKTQVRAELAEIKTKLSLSDEQVKQIRESTTESVKAVAAERAVRHAATGQRGASVSHVELLPREISNVILNRLSDFATKDQLTEHRQVVETRLRLQREYALTGLVVSLDGRLALLGDQRQKIRQLLAKNWMDAWTRSGAIWSVRTASLPEDLPYAGIDELLTGMQREALKLERQPPSIAIGLEALGPGTKPEALAKVDARYRSNLQRAMGLQTEAVARRCGLTAVQRKKLDVLSKKVIEDLARDRSAAQSRVQRAFAARRPGIVDPRDVEVVSHSAAALLPTYEAWAVLVQRVLDDDQDKQFQQMQSARTRDRNESILRHVAASMSRQLKLSAGQSVAFSRLLTSDTPGSQPFHMMSPKLHDFLLGLPSEKYIAAIGEPNWLTLKAQFEDAQRRLKAIREGRGRVREAKPDRP